MLHQAIRGAGCALLLAAGLGAQAVPPSRLKAADYVNDFAHVLAPAAVAQLDQQARALQDRHHVQVALVTVATTGDEAVGDYAVDLATHWGVGTKQDTGLLILFAVRDHKDSTQVGYGLEPYITDADAGLWMRQAIPQLRAADYGAAFAAILDQAAATLDARMGAAAGASPPAAPGAYASSPRGAPGGGLLAFAILMLVVFVFNRLAGGGRGGGSGCLWLPFLFLGGGGGRGYRGGGFGGFGGGGGGGFGGFGGFGGGGFGGGGASGGW